MNGQGRRIKGGVAISFVLAGALVIGQGCGGGFLGLEDYQRDLLLGGLAVAILSQQDAGDDPVGAPVDGRDGVDGLNCWDLNGDGVRDAEEDTNGDGSVDVLDCRGSDGATGADGADGADGANGANGANGSDGSTGPRGPAGPEFFDVWVDDFFGFDDRTIDGAAIIEDPRLPVGVISLDEPVLRWESESPIAYRVAVPPRYDAGNDVTMRLFLYRTGRTEGDCMILTLDARRLRDGTGVEVYDRDGAELSVPGRRWIRVDGVENDETVVGDGVESGVMVMVDLPLNTAAGLNYGNDLMAGDLLAFELNVYKEDGRSYQMVGAEFYETPTGSARSWNAEIFEHEDDVTCAFDDCNRNGIPDEDELEGNDCNENGILDECEKGIDCDENGTFDECELEGNDCNENGILDVCELDGNDCNENGVLDECDLCENAPGVAAAAGPGALPFTFMQAGFTQELYAVSAGFMGGVAFAPDGDVLVDSCAFGGSSLRRFDAQTTTVINGSTVHPFIGALPSDAGCGLTNHPDGTLYSNTGGGVSNLHADTGAVLRPSFGSSGNALGIAPDPQTGDLVYVGSDGTLFVVDAAFTTSAVYSTATTDKFVDGIYFDPTGDFLFCANRTDRALTIVGRDGSLVQSVAIVDSGGGHEPDGIAFHATDPKFVVTINLDGTMTRFDFPGDDFTQAPTTSLFASGGFRGDLSQVGSDGCLYLTQNQTRYADGTTSGDNSVVRVCGEFNPGVPSDLVLSPQEAFNALGTSHTVTATFSVDSDPVEGATVHFEVFAGPNAPMTGSANTGPGGEASFTYDGLGGLGIDQIQASVVGETGTKFSNIVTKTWVEPDCSQDCNGNGIPDECELVENDCNENGIPDDCDGGCEECVCHEDISTVCQPFDTVNTASIGMPVFYDEPVTDGECMFGCVDPGQTAGGGCSVECNWNSGNLFPVGDTVVSCTSYLQDGTVAGLGVDECSFVVTVDPYTVPCAGTFTGSWNSGELSGEIEGELLTDGTVAMTFLNLLGGSSMRADGLVSECGEISAFNSEFQMSVIGSMFADDGCYGRGEFGGGGQSGTWGVTIDVP